MNEIYMDPSKRQDFVLLFDVVNGNPNGDPDAGNLPRVDPETMHGLVTDVCLKRKVRDYLQLVHSVPIFIQSRLALNTLIEQAGKEADPEIKEKLEKYDKLQDREKRELTHRPHEKVRVELCRRYYDIRMFGAVLSTGRLNAGLPSDLWE